MHFKINKNHPCMHVINNVKHFAISLEIVLPRKYS